ncbi:MAG: ABC transporter ATP-binding protein [Lautropia sp.]
MIEIRQVSKRFALAGGERVDALSDVTLTVAQGEFVCLVGPSGCGKSTLLRLIGGLLPVSSGRIAVAGSPVTEPRGDTGIVFQTATLLPWATVLDNVLFPLKMMHRLQPDSRDKAMALLEMAGLAGFEKRHPHELSGGMQMRASVCRALVHDPAILLMDEPFGALDALTREEITLELMRILRISKKTVVFVTHSIGEAILLADRVVVMSPRPGRIAEVIDIDMARPRNFGMESLDAFQRAAGRIREHIFGSRRIVAA